ncbi:DEAD/DEAH box helicase [Propionibacteriaceae bacterium G1746]|uniref:DEAD/DEAH box helicase n=1 Tax=Aestuariimicrobium sp. G57 TaxID=3418485 RepID=UPI003C1E5C27
MRLDAEALRGSAPEAVFEQVVDAAGADGLGLYPHQEEAILATLTGANTIITTPTGSGKSLIAIGAHAAALAQGGRTWYTAPIKALVSEKFFALCDVFGAANVGMVTGDSSVNSEAPIICCTAEIVANMALRQGPDAPIDQVVMDEFHFIGDPDRGWAWQVGLTELPRAQFVIMSATLGDVTGLAKKLAELTGRESVVVGGAQRPVPLAYRWAMTPINETVDELIEADQAPVYIVHATQSLAFQRAQALMSTPLVDKDGRARIVVALGGFRFGKGFGTTLSTMVRAGIGVHHAGMLPRYRRVVETLAQQGLLRAICGTDTLGVGINVPIRTVLFNALTKFDGHRLRVLRSREFHQIAGRAGRAGFDSIGYVVAQAPEHVIENERALAKIGDDPKKLRKFQRKKAPEGFVNWSEDTFSKLQDSVPETLHARMRITHATLLNLLERDQDTVEAVVHLVEHSTDDQAVRRRLYRRALALGRSLLSSGTVIRLTEPTPGGRRFALSPDLQADFALNQPLSAFATEVLEVLDPESPTHVLDIVSVIEATLEDPRPVLFAQQHRERGNAVAEMKADGMDYEERMQALEDVSWPRPLAELLEHTFSLFQPRHPWIAEAALSPKSIVRDMYERAMTFGEYVAWLKLERVEGLLLRYLSDAFRALRQTVPESVRTPEFEVLLDWLGDVVRMTDSSLLDEWEALTQWDGTTDRPVVTPTEHTLTSNERTFTVMVKNAMWQRVSLAAADNVDALEALEPGNKAFTGDDWDEALGEYWDEHDEMLLDADARSASRLLIDRTNPRVWVVRQIISDPEGNHDWQVHAVVDLDASDEAEALVMRTKAFGRLD